MIEKTIKAIKPQLESAYTHFEEELAALRTGRANPSLVEGISADCYGTKTPLKQIANIHAPDARSIVIQPWDKGNLQAIEKAISESELGLTCQSDGEAIRVNLPDLTEERRKELTKVLNQKIEEAKISVRNAREEAWEKIQEAEKNKEISEDEMYRGKDELQKAVDEYNKKIYEKGKQKETEIMQV